MEEKVGETVAAAAVAVAPVVAGDQDGVAYCSEHPYPPGAAAAAGVAAGGGICAFCLQEKLGMLVSSSKSSPFHPPPASASSSTPTSHVAAESSSSSLPLHPSAAAAARKVIPASAAGGLKRSKSVAPRPEETTPVTAPAPSAVTADSPRKKSFWSFLYSSSSSSSGGHQGSASMANGGGGGGASVRRKSVSVASASSASLGRRLEAIVEPDSPGRRSEGSSSSSFGRKVARSRSVGCGSRSFSGDFLERLSTGFGDCALRRVESHREPKPKSSAGALAHLGGNHSAAGNGDDDEYESTQQHRIKCAGFFGGLGAAPPPTSSSYWLSAADGATAAAPSARTHGARSHRSWAWALASPMRALRPTSSSSSKSIMAAPHNRGGVSGNGGMAMAALACPQLAQAQAHGDGGGASGQLRLRATCIVGYGWGFSVAAGHNEDSKQCAIENRPQVQVMRIAADELRRQGIAHKLKFYVLQQFNDESICASYAAIGCLCDCSTSALLSSGYGGRKGSTCLSSYSSRLYIKIIQYPTAPAHVIPSLVPKDSYGFFILSYGMCAGYILMSVMMSLQEI
uniref:Uncharacterized protein n=1 Tax=Oryza rufipogon TaxID=4529 RepID=A0A0E0P8Q4_ORYRU